MADDKESTKNAPFKWSTMTKDLKSLFIPHDFGARSGTPISNKDEILNLVDATLGTNRPPDVEYIFVEPFSDSNLPILRRWSRNHYGHAAVRYTLPNGEQRLMNIVGRPGAEMVNFLNPKDYLFTTEAILREEGGADQGGIYNRSMVSVRVEKVDPEIILKLDNYYQTLHSRSQEKQAKFSLLFSPLFNLLYSLLPSIVAERGNCARWTSEGLREVGLLPKATMWPKKIWVDLFEYQGSLSAANVHVVKYRKVVHANRDYGAESDPLSGVQPFAPISNLLYSNLDTFSNIIVEVPNDSTEAVVNRVEKPYRPNWWRYHRTEIAGSVTGAVVIAALVFGRVQTRARPRWKERVVFKHVLRERARKLYPNE